MFMSNCSKARVINVWVMLCAAFFVSLVIAENAFADDEKWDGTIPTADASYTYSGGTGTSDDPYLISSGADLAMLAANTNANAGGTQTEPYTKDKHFKLTKDIDLGSNPWTPIGVYNRSYVSAAYTQYMFWGDFDGDGNEIKNLYISDTDKDGQALFGRVWGNGAQTTSAIRDLTVSGKVKAGSDVAGIIALAANTKITGCTSIVDITSTFGASTGGTAGVVGRIASGTSGAVTIDNCTNLGQVKSDGGEYYIGGIVGYEGGQSAIKNCDNHGNIIMNKTDNYAAVAGGIVGYVNNSKEIKNCYNTASVSATRNNTSIYVMAGGIAGWAQLGAGLEIKNVYNMGEVNAKCTAQNNVNYEAQGEIIGCVGYTSTPSNTWSVDGLYYSNRDGNYVETRSVNRNAYNKLYTKAPSTSKNISAFDDEFKLISEDIFVSEDLVDALNDWVTTESSAGGSYNTWKTGAFWPAVYGTQTNDDALTKSSYKQELLGHKDLDDYREAERAVLSAILQDAFDDIDEATTVESIEKIVTDAKGQMDEVKTDAELTAEEEELQRAKDEAIAELQNYKRILEYKGYRDDEQAELNSIMTDAETEINAVPKYENIDDIAPIVTKAKEDMDAVKTNADLLEEEKAELEKERDQALSEKNAALQAIAKVQEDLDKANSTIAKLEADLETAEQEIEEANKKLTDKEGELSDALADLKDAEDKIDELNSEITTLNETIASKKAEIEELQKSDSEQLATARARITELEEQVSGLEDELKTVSDEKKQIEQDLAALNDTVKELQGEIESLEGERDDAISQANSLTEQITSLNESISELNTKLSEYEDMIAELEQSISDLEGSDEENEAKIAKLEYQNAVLRAKAKKVSNFKVKAKKGKKANLTWKVTAGASGYQIQRSLKKSKGFKAIKTINKAATKKFLNKSLKAKKAYYYRMRTITKVTNTNGKLVKIYGTWTPVKKIKAKK